MALTTRFRRLRGCRRSDVAEIHFAGVIAARRNFLSDVEALPAAPEADLSAGPRDVTTMLMSRRGSSGSSARLEATVRACSAGRCRLLLWREAIGRRHSREARHDSPAGGLAMRRFSSRGALLTLHFAIAALLSCQAAATACRFPADTAPLLPAHHYGADCGADAAGQLIRLSP